MTINEVKLFPNNKSPTVGSFVWQDLFIEFATFTELPFHKNFATGPQSPAIELYIPKSYQIKKLDSADEWTFYCFADIPAACEVGGDSGKVITLRPSVSVERKAYRLWLVDAVISPIDTDTGDEFAFKGATFYHTVIVDQPLPTSLSIEN